VPRFQYEIANWVYGMIASVEVEDKDKAGENGSCYKIIFKYQDHDFGA
jgi:hypothetical protein